MMSRRTTTVHILPVVVIVGIWKCVACFSTAFHATPPFAWQEQIGDKTTTLHQAACQWMVWRLSVAALYNRGEDDVYLRTILSSIESITDKNG
jgi:hypothetical protein